MNLKTTVAGIALEIPIFNASGPGCTTKEELEGLGESMAGAIITKSCTLEPRGGNPSPRYVDVELGSINSMGLPNLGYETYKKYIPDLGKFSKPIFASVSGMKLEDNLTIIKELCQVEQLEAIELNLSCPNLVGKPQVGYDFEQTIEVLEKVQNICTKTLGVKLPPYFDFVHFQQMADILNKTSVKFVTCVNSLGNGLIIDPEKEEVLIKPKGGFGGIGGKMIKPFGLSNVRKFRELLRDDISIIGVGGITCGLDVFEYILAGADAVQLGTVYAQEGPKVFERIVKELEEVMEKKGYSQLADFKNKLKVL